jgi:hypothetical protein
MRRTRVNLLMATSVTIICALTAAGSAGAHTTAAMRPFKCSTANICKVTRVVHTQAGESKIDAATGCKSRWIRHTGENATGQTMWWIKDTTRWCYGPRVYDDSCVETHATFYIWHAADPDKCQAHVALSPGNRRSRVANVFSEQFAGITAESISNDVCMRYSKGGGWKEGGC